MYVNFFREVSLIEAFQVNFPTHFRSPHARYMPCRFNHPSCDHHNIWCRVQVTKFLILQFFPVICQFLPLRSRCFREHWIMLYRYHLRRRNILFPLLKALWTEYVVQKHADHGPSRSRCLYRRVESSSWKICNHACFIKQILFWELAIVRDIWYIYVFYLKIEDLWATLR
jgi:hypothetical protein